jgi:hypothetical protein
VFSFFLNETYIFTDGICASVWYMNHALVSYSKAFICSCKFLTLLFEACVAACYVLLSCMNL